MKTRNQLYILAIMLLFAFTPLIADDSTKAEPRKMFKIMRNEKPEPTLALGAGIGYPTGVSILSGWYSEPLAVRLSAGVAGSGWQGAQADISYMVMRFYDSRHDVSLTGGVFRYEESDSNGRTYFANQTYVGPAYSVFYRGFHFQLGLAYGIEDYSHYVLLFQAGYLFKIL